MGTDKRTVKSYNNYARKWAKRMRSGENVAHDFLEKPAMRKLLPDLNGKDILCVGCGSGEECGYLKSAGAEHVIGIDLSEKLIEIAQESFPEIEFHQADIENLEFTEGRFDLVYSSLVMHYLDDWQVAFKNIYNVLKPSGRYLFSTHHPLFNSLQKIKENNTVSRMLGFTRKQDENIKILGDYYTSRLIEDVWFEGEFEVNYYHRSLQDIIADILKSGFVIDGFYEPKATAQAQKIDPEFYQTHQKLPLFMIFDLIK